ncbi:MAG: thioredoxin fold domain-containing protein [Bacteroidota bacterium]
MKHYLFAIGFIFIGLSINAQGITFFQGTFEEAQVKAKKENKLVFMHADAVWNGTGKRMKLNVFTNSEVGEYFNQNFINLFMDMEKGEGPDLARKYRVRAYPTFLFLNAEGDEVYRATGAKKTEEFIQLGVVANSKK